jgi:hypothetical protein
VSTGSGRPLGIPGTTDCLLKRSFAIMGSSTPSRTPTLSPSRPWPGASAGRRRWQLSRTGSLVMPTLIAWRHALLKTTIKRTRLACSQKGQASMHCMCMKAPPLHQQELQDGCVILAQNLRSTNLHFRPVGPGGHSPHTLVSPSSAVAADRADNSANLAAGPAFP